MKPVLLIGWLFFAQQAFAQTGVSYVGTVNGKDAIEMELSSDNGKDFTGRYRYQGTKVWILLRGTLIYDKRKPIPENLVLKEFVGNRDIGTFDLYRSGKTLTGTWSQNTETNPLPVQLVEGKADKATAIDGFYYAGHNEMKVTTVSDNALDVTVWIANNQNCTGIKLTGRLLKVGNEWKGSLPDEYDNGEAAVVLSFAGDKANIEIIPAFLPGTDCQIGATPYLRQMRKESGELK